jgi:hypothetical protein
MPPFGFGSSSTVDVKGLLEGSMMPRSSLSLMIRPNSSRTLGFTVSGRPCHRGVSRVISRRWHSCSDGGGSLGTSCKTRFLSSMSSLIPLVKIFRYDDTGMVIFSFRTATIPISYDDKYQYVKRFSMHTILDVIIPYKFRENGTIVPCVQCLAV